MSAAKSTSLWPALGGAVLAAAFAARHFMKSPIVSQPKSKSAADSKAVAVATAPASKDLDLKYISDLITAHNDFPKKGVVFRDIFPVLRGMSLSAFLALPVRDHSFLPADIYRYRSGRSGDVKHSIDSTHHKYIRSCGRDRRFGFSRVSVWSYAGATIGCRVCTHS